MPEKSLTFLDQSLSIAKAAKDPRQEARRAGARPEGLDEHFASALGLRRRPNSATCPVPLARTELNAFFRGAVSYDRVGLEQRTRVAHPDTYDKVRPNQRLWRETR